MYSNNYIEVPEIEIKPFLIQLKEIGYKNVKFVERKYDGTFKSTIFPLEFQLIHDWFDYNTINYVYLEDKIVVICEEENDFDINKKVNRNQVYRELKIHKILRDKK